MRFACVLLIETELSMEEIGDEADQILIEYLARFPDPKDRQSAVLLEDGGVEFVETSLTPALEAAPSQTEESND